MTSHVLYILSFCFMVVSAIGAFLGIIGAIMMNDSIFVQKHSRRFMIALIICIVQGVLLSQGVI
jgi:hypothetical protein